MGGENMGGNLRFIVKLAMLAAFSVVAKPALADIVIDVGPTYTPPGIGSTTDAGTGVAFTGGRTFTTTGTNLSLTENLYFGIKNDEHLTGYSTDGGAISGSEIFSFDSVSSNSIVYIGTSNMEFSDSNPDFLSPTRLTLTFTGAGTIIQDGTTAGLSNAMGAVGALWRVEGDFSVNFLIEATAPPFDMNTGNFEPGNDLFNRLGNTLHSTRTSVDSGYYYEIAAVPEPSSFLFLGGVATLYALRNRRKRLTQPYQPRVDV